MKLVVLALLVAAAAAANPFTHLAATVRSFTSGAKLGMPSNDCLLALITRHVTATELGILDAKCTPLLNATVIDFQEVCYGECATILAKFIPGMDEPACAGDFPVGGPDRIGMLAYQKLVCKEVDGVLCMAQLAQIGAGGDIDPFTSEMLANDTMMAKTVCSPCMRYVLDQMKTIRTGKDSSDAMIMGYASTVDLMCTKEDDHYCLTNTKLAMAPIKAALMNSIMDPDFVTKWDTAAAAICPKTCFQKVLTGFMMLNKDPFAKDESRNQYATMALLKVMCAKPPGENVYCAHKSAAAWVRAAAESEGCAYPLFGAGYTSESQFKDLVCNAQACDAVKLNQYFNEIGCCGGMMRDGAVKHYRDAIGALTSHCGIQINDTSCVVRKTGELIGKYRFPNLRYSYFSDPTKLYELKYRIKLDIASVSQMDPNDISVEVAALSLSSHSAVQLTATQAVEATVTADCNQPDCQKAQSSTVSFNSVGGLPSEAAIDPGMNPGAQPGSAFTVAVSAMAVIFALLVALF